MQQVLPTPPKFSLLAGFGAQRQKSTSISYIVFYRTVEGRQRVLTIGRHGSPWTPDAARKEAKRVLGSVAGGADPSEEKQSKRHAENVSQLCDFYLADAKAGRVLGKRKLPKKTKTLVITDESRIERHIKPLLGKRSIKSITRSDVEAFMYSVELQQEKSVAFRRYEGGKTLFIRRFFKRMLPDDLRKKTIWAFLNFNTEVKDAQELRDTVLTQFLRSFRELNEIDLDDNDEIEKLFSHEIAAFERGPAKNLLKSGNDQQYHQQRYFRIKELTDDKEKVVGAISRHYAGERRIGLVVVFDNVDKRSRDVQLAIFEAAQWFKELTRALVIVNMRDTTFEAHRDEKPLDAFINAVNFYIRAPRFALMIRSRLEIVLENIESAEEVSKLQKFTLESGAQVVYQSNRLGQYMMSIYASLFDRRASQMGAAIESLAAKNARSALGMFADIIASPHIPTSQMGSTAAASSVARIEEDRLIRALMADTASSTTAPSTSAIFYRRCRTRSGLAISSMPTSWSS